VGPFSQRVSSPSVHPPILTYPKGHSLQGVQDESRCPSQPETRYSVSPQGVQVSQVASEMLVQACDVYSPLKHLVHCVQCLSVVPTQPEECYSLTSQGVHVVHTELILPSQPPVLNSPSMHVLQRVH